MLYSFALLRHKKIVDFILRIIAFPCSLLKLDKLLFFILKKIKNLVKIFIFCFIIFYKISEKIYTKIFLTFKLLTEYIYFKLNNFKLFFKLFYYIYKKFNSFNNLRKIKKINSNYKFIKNICNLEIITEKFIEKLSISFMYFILYFYFKNLVYFHILGYTHPKFLNKIKNLIPNIFSYRFRPFPYFFTHWVLIQVFVLRDYLEMPRILKYNILITLIIFSIFYAFMHIIESFFEKRTHFFTKSSALLNNYLIKNIRLVLYFFTYLIFNICFFYFYIKSITIKDKEHVYKKKNILYGISKSFYSWIRYGVRAKEKRRLK